MTSLYVGVDAGGTHAVAVVVDEGGHEIGRGRAPGAVASSVSVEAAAEAVARAVSEALAAAGRTGPVHAVWAGVAGAGTEAVRSALEDALAHRLSARHVGVGTDMEAAFESAFGQGPGILLIAGTGSAAMARDGGGRFRRAGGWGRMLGDEGGGYWIGMHALGAVARAEEGRAQQTALREAVLRGLGLEAPRDLVDWVEGATKAEIAALAPAVLAVAEQGDPVAASIATDAAAALRTHVIALLAAMERDGATVDGVTVALSGGLIREGGPLRPTLERLLEPLGRPLHQGALDPPMGAARLAARL